MGIARAKRFRLAVSVFAAAVAAAAQPGATFDVASVRANKSGPQGTNIKRSCQNGVNMVNVQLRAIIQLAYPGPWH